MEDQNNKPGKASKGASLTRKPDCILGGGCLHDVWMKIPKSKEPVRPKTFFIYDGGTGKILASRTGEKACGSLAALAICDVIETFGIPNTFLFKTDYFPFDSQWITGDAPKRYRFRVRRQDPLALLAAIGVKVRCAGPEEDVFLKLERRIRDIREEVDGQMELAGAHSSNNRQCAISLDEFEAVIQVEIVRWNARRNEILAA